MDELQNKVCIEFVYLVQHWSAETNCFTIRICVYL